MQIRHSSRLNKQVAVIRFSLPALGHSLRGIVPISDAAEKKGAEPWLFRRRPRLSAKARASLAVQGRYMGYMRLLKPRQKAQVRKIKEVKGVRAAIRSAKDLAKG